MKKPRGRSLVIGAVAALAFFAVALATSARAQDRPPEEYEIKAAFLYNFTKFVEWPPEAFPDARAPIVIGILGPDPFGTALEDIIEGKRVSDRGLVVRPVTGSSQLGECQVLFVNPTQAAEFARLLSSIARQPILTVGETARFAETGGIVQFVMRQRKVRFRINVAAAGNAGLKISSRLLDLAEVVGKAP